MLNMHIPFSRTVKILIKNKILESQINKISVNWVFDKFHKDMIVAEYDEWLKTYGALPINNNTILDIGAGEGETALFFKYHNAQQVIAVEPNKEFFSYLKVNAEKNNFLAINEKISLPLLRQYMPHVDAIKCDIEGYEELLLNCNIVKPIVLELHGLPLIEKFKQQNYIIFKNISDTEAEKVTCTRYAYKNLPKRKQQK